MNIKENNDNQINLKNKKRFNDPKSKKDKSKHLKKSIGSFMIKILNGTAIGSIVALVPNAILSTFFKPFLDIPIIYELNNVIVIFQYLTCFMSGFVVGYLFKFSPMQSSCVGGATFIGSGAWSVVTTTVNGAEVTMFEISCIGDLINIMLVASLAVIAVKLLSPKLGSFNIILLPLIVGVGVGFVGILTYPYVSMITSFIGDVIKTFTSFTPMLASIFICIAFALLIISPISTVAIAMTVGLEGISSAAAGMGVTACAAFLIFATAHVNKKSIPIAIALGAIKMMMANFFSHPIMALPISFVAALCAISVPLTGMGGTPATAGFGLAGLISPLAALDSSDIGIFGMIMF